MARAKYNGRNTKAVTKAAELLMQAAPNAQLFKDYPMSCFATIKTGGNADLLAKIFDKSEFISLLDIYKQNNIDFIVLGNGSNVLISDSGIKTPILNPCFKDVYATDESHIYAQAGCSLKQIANFAANNSLSGLEFAAGIPGTLGGAIVMNAGAYGGELCDCVVSVDIWNTDDGVKTVPAHDADFTYRHSKFAENGDIILGALFKLKHDDNKMILDTMNELAEKRRLKQPLNMPSAGSAFKRPKDNFAGALIEQCGLKGAQIGGAAVSEKHCGFIVNTGNASSRDVYNLINRIIETVKSQTGIILEPEIKFIGDFNYPPL